MANIRTIALNGAETKVEIAGQNCAVRNDGTETVYASRRTGIIAGADGVLAVPAGQSAVLRDTCGTLYLLGTGSVQLVGADYDSLPFKTVSASGGSGADEVARAAISAHAGNAEVHVTADEKSAWNAKAELSDIPTSLPANGGNADTVDGKYAEEFMWKNEISGVGLGFTFGQNVTLAEFITAMAEKFGENASIFSLVKWNDSEYCNIICDDETVIQFNGGFICGYASPTDGIWKNAKLVYFPANDTDTTNNAYVFTYRMHASGTAPTFSIYKINDNGNADTVDKMHAVDIMNMACSSSNRSIVSANTDLDNLITGGRYLVSSSGEAVTIGHTAFDNIGYYIDIYRNGVNDASNVIVQVAMNYNGAIKVRSRTNGTFIWSSWVNINDGGNAAALENHPASDFVLKSEYDALAARVAALEGGA